MAMDPFMPLCSATGTPAKNQPQSLRPLHEVAALINYGAGQGIIILSNSNPIPLPQIMDSPGSATVAY